MRLSRREFVASAVGAALTPALLPLASARGDAADMPIIDTHQHLWDLEKHHAPLARPTAPEVLKHNYGTEDTGRRRRASTCETVYMEVDVAPDQKVARGRVVLGELCQQRGEPHARRGHRRRPVEARLRGLHQVARPSRGSSRASARSCTTRHPRRVLPARRVRAEHPVCSASAGLSFDLCMRPGELADGAKLAESAPTRDSSSTTAATPIPRHS